jgi:hypothetical protein
MEQKVSNAKRRLNLGAAKRMTIARLLISDPDWYLENWLAIVGQACR